MKSAGIVGMIVVIASGLGFVLGKFSAQAPSPELPRTTTGSAPALRVVETAGSAAPHDVRDVRNRDGQWVADLRQGSREELMVWLREVIADRALPPLLTKIYRDAIVERLVKIGAAEELLERSTDLSETHREAVVTVTVRVLAETDLLAAEEITKRLPTGPVRKNAMAAFLGAFGKRDPRRGLAWIESNPEARESEGALFFTWAKIDPRAAAEEAIKRKEGSEAARHSVMSAWVEEDPEGAWQWIEALPPANRGSAAEAYFAALAWWDPSRALDAMATKPELSDNFMGQWIGLLIASDVAGARAAVDRLPPGAGRTALIGGIARSLAGDPAGAVAWANTLLSGERETALSNLFDSLGQLDPERALDLTATQLEDSLRQKAIASVVSGWARDDFEAAFAAMAGKLDVDTLREAIPTVFRYQAFPDDESIASRFAAVGKLDSRVRSDALRALGESVAFQRPDDWLRQLSRLSPADREAFAEGAMKRSFELPPTAVVQLAEMLPPDKQAKQAREIGRAMSQVDLRKTVEFLSRLPEGGEAGTTRQALQDTVREWTYVEPDAALSFVGLLQAGETKDAVSETLARQLRHFDLDRATQVIATTTTQKVRNTLIEELSRDWARVDPNRGRALMQPLLQSEEERKHADVLFDLK